MAARRIALLAFPRVQAIDVFGPLEVFSAADRLASVGEYEVELLAADVEPIETSSGIGIVPTRSLSALRGPLDTLIVAGGDGIDDHNPVLCTIRTELPIQFGDSGGPYWERATGKAVGTLTGGGPKVPGILNGASWFTPVEELPGYPKAPGSLNYLGLEGESLHVVRWKP